MKRSKALLRRLFLFMFPALLLTGCVFYVEDDGYVPARLIIQNDPASFGDIWYVYAVPSTWNDWGNDLLGGDVLYPGDELHLDIFDCDRYYDIQVEYDDGLVIEKYDIWVPCRADTLVPFID
ncbi:MAG: hypothetical protein P8Y65_07530 [Campylobacterales bacterium]|jgi:hypothetical protein